LFLSSLQQVPHVLRFIANCFAVIGFLVVALFVWGITAAIHQNRVEPEPQSVVVTLDFTQPIVEHNEHSPFAMTLDDEPVELLDLVTAIDRASRDPRVKGISARFGAVQPSLAHAQEIRAAIARFRETGKFTYAFGTDFGEYGLGSRAYFLASAFENIWLQPVGTVSLTGVSIQSPFAKGTLDKLGVVADFMQREEYKSFMEAAQRDSFSPPVKAEMQVMVENLANQIAGGIASSRKWDVDHVKDLMARGPFTDEEAKQEGLITKIAYSDEFDSELDRKAGADSKHVDVGTYLEYGDQRAKLKTKKTKIALIHGSGVIMDKSLDGGLGERIMGADTISEAFAEASKDDDVRAILFRVDSPGGSPAASETIRRSIVNAQKQGKPVIVSMGETAASGGYWIAMNGDRIIADPGSITGSIGVVAGKFASNGGLEKIGVTTDAVSTSPNAGMWTTSAPFTPPQRARVNALLDNTYRTFVGFVAEARKIPLARMPDIAKGRVYTGEQALAVGLVDQLGGYEEALKEVRKALNLGDAALLAVEMFPADPSPVERLRKLLRRFGAEGSAAFSLSAKLAKAQALLGSLAEMASFANHPMAARMYSLERVE
jgi:protease-4